MLIVEMMFMPVKQSKTCSSDQQSQPEYVITENTVCEGCDMCNEYGRLDCEIMVRIRQSRPHIPAPTNTELRHCKKTECIDYNTELCQPWKCSYAMQKHDAAMAHIATLAAYEELIIELNRQTTGRTKEEIRDILFICQINPTKWLQSLR
jgi:hypothetical protein